MKKKSRGVAKQAEQIRKDAHALDERAKTLRKSIHNSNQYVKQFHETARKAKKKAEATETLDRSNMGLTEKDLQRSANEQTAAMALVGNRHSFSKNPLSKRKSA